MAIQRAVTVTAGAFWSYRKRHIPGARIAIRFVRLVLAHFVRQVCSLNTAKLAKWGRLKLRLYLAKQ